MQIDNLELNEFWGRAILYDADEGQETWAVPDEAANASWHMFLFADWLRRRAQPILRWSVSWHDMIQHDIIWRDMIQHDMGSEIIYTLGQEM